MAAQTLAYPVIEQDRQVVRPDSSPIAAVKRCQNSTFSSSWSHQHAAVMLRHSNTYWKCFYGYKTPVTHLFMTSHTTATS